LDNNYHTACFMGFGIRICRRQLRISGAYPFSSRGSRTHFTTGQRAASLALNNSGKIKGLDTTYILPFGYLYVRSLRRNIMAREISHAKTLSPQRKTQPALLPDVAKL
jgi:hypothetical protein